MALDETSQFQYVYGSDVHIEPRQELVGRRPSPFIKIMDLRFTLHISSAGIRFNQSYYMSRGIQVIFLDAQTITTTPAFQGEKQKPVPLMLLRYIP